MPEIIVGFNRTTNIYYKTYAKLLYSVTYVDDLSTLKSVANIKVDFYIKPDPYTYSVYTNDTLYLGIRKGSSSAALHKVNINPTLTNNKEVKSNVYNLVGSTTFEVEYNSTSTYSVYLAAGYTNPSTARFAPFNVPQSDGSGYHLYSYEAGGSNQITLEKRISSTNCTAPTSFTVENSVNSVVADTVNLKWSNAKSGTANSITGYRIEYKLNDSSTWWLLNRVASTAVSGSYTHSLEFDKGSTIAYRIRAEGSAGSSYYSDYKYSSSVKVNTAPQAVNSLNVDASKVSENDYLTVSWENASDSENNIKEYKVEYSVNNTAWKTLVTTTGLYYRFKPAEYMEDQSNIKFRICAVDIFGEISPYKETNIVRREDYSGVKIAVSGTYKKAYVYVCVHGLYVKCQVYVCKQGLYIKGVS